jgi:hypothetical protein
MSEETANRFAHALPLIVVLWRQVLAISNSSAMSTPSGVLMVISGYRSIATYFLSFVDASTAANGARVPYPSCATSRSNVRLAHRPVR